MASRTARHVRAAHAVGLPRYPDDKESPMLPFTQVLDPLHSLAGSTLLALVPVATLLLLAVFRMSAWRVPRRKEMPRAQVTLRPGHP